MSTTSVRAGVVLVRQGWIESTVTARSSRTSNLDREPALSVGINGCSYIKQAADLTGNMRFMLETTGSR